MNKDFCSSQSNIEKIQQRTGNYMFPNGIIVGIGGCSAVGKSTIIERISEKINAVQAYSVTTRAIRGPDDKRIPVSMDEYLQMLNSSELIEGIIYDGHGYGIPKAAVAEILSRGQVALIDANESGIEQLLKTDLTPTVITIFLVSSAQELVHRQLSRGAGTKESRLFRIQNSMVEIESAKKTEIFRFTVLNNTLDDAVNKIIQIIEGQDVHSDFFDINEFKQDMTVLLANL